MDATFEVKATPGAVKNRLVARATWSHLIPVSLSRYNSIPSASLATTLFLPLHCTDLSLSKMWFFFAAVSNSFSLPLS
jgi:hypothetical protein